MLKVTRELTRRVLSIRLKDLEKDEKPRALKDVLEEPEIQETILNLMGGRNSRISILPSADQ